MSHLVWLSYGIFLIHAEKTVILQTYMYIFDNEYKRVLGRTLTYTTIRSRLSEHLKHHQSNVIRTVNIYHLRIHYTKFMNTSFPNFSSYFNKQHSKLNIRTGEQRRKTEVVRSHYFRAYIYDYNNKIKKQCFNFLCETIFCNVQRMRRHCFGPSTLSSFSKCFLALRMLIRVAAEGMDGSDITTMT